MLLEDFSIFYLVAFNLHDLLYIMVLISNKLCTNEHITKSETQLMELSVYSCGKNSIVVCWAL